MLKENFEIPHTVMDLGFGHCCCANHMIVALYASVILRINKMTSYPLQMMKLSICGNNNSAIGVHTYRVEDFR